MFKELVYILLSVDARVFKKYKKISDGNLYVDNKLVFEEE
jgi:hypothetical protein